MSLKLRTTWPPDVNRSRLICWRKIEMAQGLIPRFRNLISEKVLKRLSTLKGRERADIHHGPESLTPLKAEYIGADHLPFFVFRLQLCGGPYIPIISFLRTYQVWVV